MRKVTKLLIFQWAKIVFVFTPIAIFIFFLLYVLIQYMNAHGMRESIVLPLVGALALLFYLAKFLVGNEMKEMTALHKEHQFRGGIDNEDLRETRSKKMSSGVQRCRVERLAYF